MVGDGIHCRNCKDLLENCKCLELTKLDFIRPIPLKELIADLKTAREMRSMCAKGREKVYDENIENLLNKRYYTEEQIQNQ